MYHVEHAGWPHESTRLVARRFADSAKKVSEQIWRDRKRNLAYQLFDFLEKTASEFDRFAKSIGFEC